VVSGLLATGAGLAVGELVVGLVAGASSPVVAVGQAVIDRVPPPVKDWAIDTFGTNDKVVLVAGAIVVIGLIGAIVGVLAVRGSFGVACVVTTTIGLVGALAVIDRPAPTPGKLLPVVLGTLTSIATLWWLTHGRATGGPARDGTSMGLDRRQFVSRSIAVGGLAVIAGGLGRMLQQRFDIATERAAIVLPRVTSRAGSVATSELGVTGITPFVVPNDSFYRIDTAITVPQVSIDGWRLRIGGLVDNELELTFDDLLARPQIERYITLSCVSNPVGGTLVGNARWQGVRLADLLDEAGLRPGAEQVVSRSIDGWTCGSPTEVVMDGRDAMLAIAMNGEPLPAAHGYPVRIVVPGLFGYVSATKWVTDIMLTRWEDFDGYWIPRGWSKLGPVKTMARIDTPRSGTRIDGGAGGGEVAVGGVAWAVHRGVSAVQVRIDDDDWVDAELAGVPSSDTWVQWVYRWVPEPGPHVVQARAIDLDGEIQPETPKAVAPDGAQGYHRITVTA
jgi:DMSO/TMAO reductase YedYZ molybdopterin-dependent catalytic subunit/uncharacterized membrane protein (UPF0136 family)